ncbi:MAG TPA: hypothetical protein VGH50_12465 [Candidatus Binatia bacterium]|jgi:hypothetical protein
MPPLGIEGAKGIAEKIQPLVQFPVLMRVVLPGGLAMAIIYPFTPLQPDLLSADIDQAWREIVVVIAATFIAGALISALGGKLYEIYEGRRWPRWLSKRLVARQAARVVKLRQVADKAGDAGDNNLYDETWLKLRMYPFGKDGEPYAARPTRLGNILAAYEDYPGTRYGMDSVFYWPRLWLQVDKDTKAEIDSSWSIADGFLYLSAVAIAGGALWLAAEFFLPGVKCFAHLPFALVGCKTGGLALMAAGYIVYRLSLTFHVENGETFKALFDLFREKLKAMTEFGAAEAEKWDKTWAYLQYLMVSCPNCEHLYQLSSERCPNCGQATNVPASPHPEKNIDASIGVRFFWRNRPTKSK